MYNQSTTPTCIKPIEKETPVNILIIPLTSCCDKQSFRTVFSILNIFEYLLNTILKFTRYLENWIPTFTGECRNCCLCFEFTLSRPMLL